MKQNLIIDIGNTRSKVALFNKNTLTEKAIHSSLALGTLFDITAGRSIEGVIMTASGSVTEGVERWLSTHYFFIKLDQSTPIPIDNQYGTPQTLGKDRLAAAVAAHLMFPEKACLVIDCGTCLTYNIISADGAFLGGSITPGLLMRLKAMHHFTARLPEVMPLTEGVLLYGTTTESGMQSGAQMGILSEVEGFIKRYEATFSPLQVVITGGDGQYIFDNIAILNKYFEPNLVLNGLNHILNFNLKHEF